MAEIGRWGGHKFEVSANLVRGFTGLTLKGSSETEEKDASGEKYVSRKGGKPKEVKLDILLLSYLGSDVRSEALQFINEATSGKTDYFYVGNKKLVTCQLMLTEASVKDVKIVGSGTWTNASVSLTMKQCTKNDSEGPAPGNPSSGGGGSSSYNGSSSQRVSVQTIAPAIDAAKKVAGVFSPVAQVVKNVAQNAAGTVKNVLTGKTATGTAAKVTGVAAAVSAAVKKVTSVSSAGKAATTTGKQTTASAVISRILGSVKKK